MTGLRVFLLLPFVATLADCLTFSLNAQNDAVFVVDEKFLSVALDCSNIEGRFSDFDLTDPYLTKLVRHLAPMYFRVGGTYADTIKFSDDVTNSSNKSIGLPDVTFLASDYLKVYQFTQNANVRLIFDLNSLLRNEDGTWNSENAEQMIKFSNDHQIALDWELGNEPDLYGSIYGKQVGASQLATDYRTLRGILDQYELYKSSYLIGNDMFDVGGSQSNQDYLGTFLQGASDVVHAVTWHQYYFPGREATEQLFLSPSTFNYLEQRINVVKNVVGSSGSGNKIWLGETSSAYNGGAANMSDRFIGTFLWLDKLGLGAQMGLDVIIRQTIFHDNYALIDNDYIPNPDWWLSVLYKRLVGTKALAITNDGTSDNTVRLYAHCAKDNELWKSSAVVVFGFNVGQDTATFNLEGLEAESAYVYELTAESSLYSQGIRLNGDLLSVSSDGDLPDLQPKALESVTGSYDIASYSIAFWVFSDTNVVACNK